MNIRLSTTADIPAMRRLWTLAFGDGGPYLDNFFHTYYRPERMIVLEREGEVRAMTAWFDTTFVLPEQGEFRAAYLYSVATDPDFRGQRLAGNLLAWADDHFRSLGIPVVTTVPAEPSLHRFFAANGFSECFCHDELRFDGAPSDGPTPAMGSLTPAEYGALRELLLDGAAHIRFPEDALTYQAGCCAISAGGLYAVETEHGFALLCAEGMSDGSLLLKELLGTPEARNNALHFLPKLLPGFSGIYRVPGREIPFGMIKWLGAQQENVQNFELPAYLGLAFD